MSATTVIQIRHAHSFYFGKIPSRGDFVKSASGAKVIPLIDNWIAQGMEMLLANPGWKNDYDNAGAVDFLFIGIRKRHAICGALIPSTDSSSRRFPFIAATLFETDESLMFLPLSPFILEWRLNHQRSLIQHASRTHDADETLRTLNDVPLEPEFAKYKLIERYDHFLATTTITGLANALSIGERESTVRQMILATGYLLEPVLKNGAVPPQKGLAMPLPRDPARLVYVKALWLDLISVFLSKTEFELSVFSCVHYGNPKLIITFNGVTPTVFHALFEEQAAHEYLIDITQAAWVEDYVQQKPTAFTLSSYLEHADLSLQQTVETFRQCFSR